MDLPAWFWSAAVCGGLFIVAVAALWALARRELARDDTSLRRPWLHSLETRIVNSIERVITNPPSWRQAGAVLAPVVLVAVVGLAGWALWTHVVDWFAAAAPAAPPTPLHVEGPGLPFESAFHGAIQSFFPMMCRITGAFSLLGALMWMAMGEQPRALAGLVLGVALFAAPSLLVPVVNTIMEPSSVLAAGSSPERPEVRAEGVTAAEGESSAMLASDLDASDAQTTNLSGGQAAEEARRHSSAHPDSDSGFGIGDALMLYGGYKLLSSGSDSSPGQSSSSTSRYAVPHATSRDTASPSISRDTPRPSASSERAGTPIYRAPASATRPLGVRSRLMSRPTYRRGR